MANPRLLAFIGVSLLASMQPVRADTPSVDYIFPAGGQRGTTVAFRVGGNFLHGSAHFNMHGEGLQASQQITETETRFFDGPMIFKPASQRGENYPRDHAGQVRIDRRAPLGAAYWRVRTSQGVTPSLPFIVGDLPEIVEVEIDGRPLPTNVAVNTTVNGRIFPREDVDVWVIDAIAGESYECEVVASRIGSPLDSLVQVFAPSGRLVAENDDSDDSVDSRIVFQAKQNGRYRVQIYDSQFRGLQNYVYRLTIRAGAVVRSVFPIGGQASDEATIQLLGVGLPPDASGQLPDGLQPGERWVSIPLPHQRYSSRILRMHIDQLNEYRLNAGESVVADEFSGNGMFDGEQRRHNWRWSPDKDVNYSLSLQTGDTSRRLRLALLDAEGKTLKEASTDPARPQNLQLALKGSGDATQIHIEPKDDSAQPLIYRLSCRRLKPDFQLRLETDAVTLYRGQQASLKVHADRTKFTGEIRLKVMGLESASKVSHESMKIAANKPNAQLKFSAAKDARVQPLHISVVGEAEIDGETVVRTAKLPTPLAYRDREEVVLGVSMPTPFTIDGVAFETRYGARGTVFRRRYLIHRNGFEGPLEAKLADRQIRHLQGVAADSLSIPAEAKEFHFPIRIPTWLEMNRTSRTVVAAVGKVKDEEGNEHTVSFSSGVPKDQIILLTAPCPIALKTEVRSVRIVPGETVGIPFRIDRGVLKPAAANVRLVVPEHIHGVEATPVTLDENALTGVLQVRIDPSVGVVNMPITLRAEMPSGADTVIAETKLELTRDD